MPPVPWRVETTDHPGSTQEEIVQEPDWSQHHDDGHRIGYRNRDDRLPGITHGSDEQLGADEIEEARKDHKDLVEKAKKGDLVNFRDIVLSEKDLHLRYPENRSLGWRYVLPYSEDWVKNREEWPANVQKLEKEQNEKRQKEEEQSNTRNKQQCDGILDEEKWKREQGDSNKHHDAYAGNAEDSGYSSDEPEKQKSEYEKLRERYSPQEIALLRAIQHEKDYIQRLEQNNGKRKSPQTHNRSTISIDEADQFSPDNWLPRSSDLIRLTGKHPLNAEANLSHLYDTGLITPNELHYVRNHGAVPRQLRFHQHRRSTCLRWHSPQRAEHDQEI
jgi:nitrate reductase (NAD(P)H)